MRRSASIRALLVAVAVAALASGSASCVAPRREGPEPALLPEAAPPRASEDDSGPEAPVASSLVRAHNARRAKAGLPPFFENPLLDAAARGHALDMAGRRKMAHRGGDGSSPFERIGRQGYRYRSAAENVAYGFDDVESVMAGWMKSPGHRRNILGPYSEVGVGRATAKDGASYWCVTFGTPLGR